MTTDGYMAFLYFTSMKGYFLDKVIAQLRRHKHNASGSRSVVTFMDERIQLIELILRDFSHKLSQKGVENLHTQKKNIMFSHINIIKAFKENGRYAGIQATCNCIKKRYF
jgi:hypothetical protein